VNASANPAQEFGDLEILAKILRAKPARGSLVILEAGFRLANYVKELRRRGALL